ncbi:hypothetical protein AAG906_039352 [Vitis piasezkii]
MDTTQRKRKNHVLPRYVVKELRYELITWIIANYDIGYHRLCMHTNVVVLMTPQDVREVLRIPNNGVDILIYNSWRRIKKSFLIFACATILAPNSKQKGMHDLWDTIWDSDVGVCKNWAKFVLQYVEDGIRDYRNSHLTYIRDCVLFLQFFYMTKFYMTYVQVEVRTPLCASWIDDQIKRRLAAEIQTYGKYGHVQVIQGKEPVVHNDSPPYEATSSHSDDPIETIEARVIQKSEQLLSLASSLAQDIATLRSSDQVLGKGIGARTHSTQLRGTTTACQASAAICKFSFVSQCLRLFLKINHQERLVADYALMEDAFAIDLTHFLHCSEILCDMHGAYITWDELSSLNGGRWVNSVLFVLVYDNDHWHVHVINIPTARVEILSSLPLRRGNGISVVSRRLSEVIDKAFHAHGMHRQLEVSKFVHVQPQIVYDCGMFAIKYMQYWNRTALAHSIAEEWLSRATNWVMFSATAGLGVIHRGHLQQGRSLTLQEIGFLVTVTKSYISVTKTYCHGLMKP